MKLSIVTLITHQSNASSATQILECRRGDRVRNNLSYEIMKSFIFCFYHWLKCMLFFSVTLFDLWFVLNSEKSNPINIIGWIHRQWYRKIWTDEYNCFWESLTPCYQHPELIDIPGINIEHSPATFEINKFLGDRDLSQEWWKKLKTQSPNL
jgi:hypothetical protein